MTTKELQKHVSRIEKVLQSFAALGRGTAVTMTGDKFASFFETTPALVDQVWNAFLNHPPGLAVDVVVSPETRPARPDPGARLTFFVNARAVSNEEAIQRLVATGVVHLHEIDAEEWLADTQRSAQLVAERVVLHSVYACAVLLVPFDLERERELRAAVRAKLAAQGSTASEAQSAALVIVAASSLSLLVDTQRCHLIVDRAHELGSEQHAEWARWAAPLQARRILQGVDLVAAADLAGTRAGFSVVHEMSKRSLLDEAGVRDLARRLFTARVDPRHAQYRMDCALGDVVRTMVRRSPKLLVLSRLAHSKERGDNVAFAKPAETAMGARVQHCALLGHDELAVKVRSQLRLTQKAPVIVLRDTVAAKLNLRDWVSFFAALPARRVILLVFRQDDTEEVTLDDYLTRARLPWRPQLTFHV